eukprot:COSAG04_NODE_1626_length_6125_cov_2.914039_2_plen_87_part_00
MPVPGPKAEPEPEPESKDAAGPPKPESEQRHAGAKAPQKGPAAAPRRDSRVGVDVGGRLLCYLYLVMLLGVLTGLGVILIVRYGVS